MRSPRRSRPNPQELQGTGTGTGNTGRALEQRIVQALAKDQTPLPQRRDRPDRARGKPHVAQHALVFGRAHEPLERGEGAVQQELEIAELARGKVPALRVAGAPPRFAGHRLVEMPGCGRAALRFLEHPHFQFLHSCNQPERLAIRALALADSAGERNPGNESIDADDGGTRCIRRGIQPKIHDNAT